MSAQQLRTMVRELEGVIGVGEVDALLHVAAPQAVEQIPGLCPHSPTAVIVEPAEVEFDLSRAIVAQFLDFSC